MLADQTLQSELESLQQEYNTAASRLRLAQAQALDPYVGKYFHYDGREGGLAQAWFYVDRRDADRLTGTLVEARDAGSVLSDERCIEVRSNRPIFWRPQVCREITREEFFNAVRETVNLMLESTCSAHQN